MIVSLADNSIGNDGSSEMSIEFDFDGCMRRVNDTESLVFKY
jgi:hypothetical protein